jgi:hypothetical protein
VPRAPGHAAQPDGFTQYRVTDLAGLGGTSISGPIDMNDRDEVTAVSTTAGDTDLQRFV